MSILNETQEQRDIELSKILGIPLVEIQSLVIACPDSIRISDGNKPENLEDLYHDYEHLDFPAHLKTLMYTSIKRRHSELIKLLKETKNKTCLDFGSGCGTHSIALMENNNLVDLLDVPGKLLDFARARIGYRKNLKPKGCTLNNHHQLNNDYYDVIICHDCLEHCDHPMVELERIHKSLKVDGILSILTSVMIKPSSGHFASSINEWKKYGQKYLNKNFEKLGVVTYKNIGKIK